MMGLIDAVHSIIETMNPEQEAELLVWMIERQPQPGAESLGAPEKWWLGKLRSGELLVGAPGWIDGHLIPVEVLDNDYIQALRRPEWPPRGILSLRRLLVNLLPGIDRVTLRAKVNGKIRYDHYYEFPGLEECRSHFEAVYGKQDWGTVHDS